MDGSHAEFIADVAGYFRRASAVEFSLLFGSVAGDDVRPSSNLDITKRFSDVLSSDERFQKHCIPHWLASTG